MAFGDVWRLEDPQTGEEGIVVDLCPFLRPGDWQSTPDLVTAQVIAGRVYYLDRILGVGETGPLIPVASKWMTLVSGPADGR